jgi:hypothetical protein
MPRLDTIGAVLAALMIAGSNRGNAQSPTPDPAASAVDDSGLKAVTLKFNTCMSAS